MNIQTTLTLKHPGRPANPTSTKTRPQQEAWTVGEQAGLSTDQVLKGDYQEPTPATYTFTHKKARFNKPGSLIGEPLMGAIEGTLLSVPFGFVGGVVGSAVHSFFGVGGGIQGALMGALAGPALVAGFALSEAVKENLSTTKTREVEGTLQQGEGGVEFKTDDPDWVFVDDGRHWSDYPSRKWDAHAASQKPRTIPLEQHSKAPVATHEYGQANQWWSGEFDPPGTPNNTGYPTAREV